VKSPININSKVSWNKAYRMEIILLFQRFINDINVVISYILIYPNFKSRQHRLKLSKNKNKKKSIIFRISQYFIILFAPTFTWFKRNYKMDVP